jgi:hypothetical protein
MSSEPIPAASAVELPEMPAKSIETVTLMWPSPPGRWPTRAGEIDQPVGDPGPVHQVGGEQEERHGQEHEGVVALEHLAQEQDRGQPVVDEEDRDDREAEREGDRHPEDDEDAEEAEEDGRDLARAHGWAAETVGPSSLPALGGGPSIQPMSMAMRSPMKSSQVAPAQGQAM